MHSLPFDVVLALLRYEVNALQHVSDVINASLLNTELLCCLVQIDNLCGGGAIYQYTVVTQFDYSSNTALWFTNAACITLPVYISCKMVRVCADY